MPETPPDFLDAAIAAAEKKEVVHIEMVQRQCPLLGNPTRPGMIAVPADATDLELFNLIAYVLQFGDEIRARRKPAIEVAHQLPVVGK